jgi:hypothetical protein
MGVGGQSHAPATLRLEKDTVAIVQEARWAPGLMWAGVENLAATDV